MLFSLKVKGAFKCKYTGKIYQPGDTLETNEIDRVNDMLQRNLCVITAVSSEDAADKAADKITFQDAEYDLDVIKEALKTIGAKVAENAKVKGVTNAIEKLSEEGKAKLAETLKAN